MAGSEGWGERILYCIKDTGEESVSFNNHVNIYKFVELI